MTGLWTTAAAGLQVADVSGAESRTASTPFAVTITPSALVDRPQSSGRSSSAYDTENRRITPLSLIEYWPMRHSGGL